MSPKKSKKKNDKNSGLISTAFEASLTASKMAIQVPVTYFQKICFWIGFSVVCSCLVFVLAVAAFLSSLPDVSDMKFSELRQTAEKVVARRLEVKAKKFKWVKLRDVSRDYLYSIVMSEDGQYFEHGGINYDSLLNSLAVNIQKKRFAVGGSTISQQVTKNLFLSNSKTLIRKFKEILITRELESNFTKNEILEIYLNMIEVGPDIYGINAASHTYFKKSPKKVNAAEGGFVALMLPSPKRNHYSIFVNKNISSSHRKKLKRILKDMRYHEFISPSQFKTYSNYSFFKKN
ncbi:transglycosylase domain-containing protein [bacterium]|nr:transglycosylase domain-containing protein [bacterium]